MNIPGFTAEKSVYEKNLQYRFNSVPGSSLTNLAAVTASVIRPPNPQRQCFLDCIETNPYDAMPCICACHGGFWTGDDCIKA